MEGHTGAVRCIATLSDGGIVSGSNDNSVIIWPLQSLSRSATVIPIVIDCKAAVCSIIVQHKLIICGLSGGDIVIYDTVNCGFKTTLTGHTSDVTCLLILPNGHLVSGSMDTTIRIWDADGSSKCIEVHQDEVRSLTYKNEFLISGSSDETACVWNLQTNSQYLSLPMRDAVVGVMFLNDDRLLTVSSTTTMLWSTDLLPKIHNQTRAPTKSQECNLIPESKSYEPAVLKLFFALNLWQLRFNIPLSALALLLEILSIFVSTLFGDSVSDELTVHRFRMATGTHPKHNDSDIFDVYAWCQNCSAIYTFDEAVSANCGVNPCTYKDATMKRQCQKTIGSIRDEPTTAPLRDRFTPRFPYVYSSLRGRLAEFFARPGFESKINHWRLRSRILERYLDPSRSSQQNKTYRDIYDGEMWKHFQTSRTDGFLDEPYSLAFSLNIDWFQPWIRGTYSAGAVYLTLLNLPRDERYAKENMILIGMLPGGKEKNQKLDLLLKPLVDELLLLWEGCVFKTPMCKDGRKVRGGLICVSCDLPAGRKLCGFKAATACCSKCKFSFRYYDTGRKRKDGRNQWGWDCSGNDVKSWVPRQHEEVKQLGIDYRSCRSKNAQKKFVKDNDVRYSILSELPYFDSVKMLVIDPMHNLWLGVSKHIIDVWKDAGVLTKAKMKQIQVSIDKMGAARRFGRMRSKVSSMSGFTAQEIKVFVLVFSQLALKNVLSNEQYSMWMHWVEACRSISRAVISEVDITNFQKHLKKFTDAFAGLDEFGSKKWVPNMHFVFHLGDDVRNFGPVYAFHLFALERFNGILGRIPNDKRNPDKAFMRNMRHYQRLTHIQNFSTILFSSDEQVFWHKLAQTMPKTVSLTDTLSWEKFSTGVETACGVELSTGIELLNQETRTATFVDVEFRKALRSKLATLYEPDKAPLIPQKYRLFKRAKICNSVFGSAKWNNGKEKHILMRWNSNDEKTTILAGYVDFFFDIDLRKDIDTDVTVRHRFARCRWFEPLSPSDNIHYATFKNVLSKESTDDIIPVACIMNGFEPAPIENGFQCLILPTQLTMWNPCDEADEV